MIVETKIHNNFNNIVQIMVRTRDLGRALGRAIRKALGRRQGSDDDNDAPSGEDLPYLLTGSNSKSVLLRILLRLQRNCTKSIKKHLLRILLLMLRVFLGGPHDTSVLRDYEIHIALRIWNGEVCIF